MEFNPDITIAIPVYERYEYFEEAIYSALKQTTKCHIIVVDNCSSHSLFKEFVENLNSEHVKYYKNDTNLGPIGNWNQCLFHVQTKWASILHSDDMLSTSYVSIMSNYITDNPDQIAFMCKYESGEAPIDILKTPCFAVIKTLKIKPSFFTFGNVTAFPGVIFDRTKVKKNSFTEKLHTVADYDLWLNIAIQKPITLVNAKLAYYRLSPTQDSANVYKKVIEQSFDYKKNHILKTNRFMNFLAMYEIYYTYNFYKRKFNVADSAHEFENEEINSYFNYFDKLPYIKFMPFIFKAYRKLYLYTSGLL
ncbi:glycosyltransferase family 2 protein [Mucilaginibacter terrae]|uniref:glycosyltransferase family 2 protein n=1 Tax=Mucilaginibacter terrae TaxID=1955052 RepID=UPI00362FDB2B